MANTKRLKTIPDFLFQVESKLKTDPTWKLVNYVFDSSQEKAIKYMWEINKYKYKKIEKPRTYTVYTDGSCLLNGRSSTSPGGIGVFFKKKSSMNVSEPFENQATNIRCELYAIYKAVLIIKKYTQRKKRLGSECLIRIISDSTFSISAVTLQFNVSKNVELIGKIIKLLNNMIIQGFTFEFIYQRGHQQAPNKKSFKSTEEYEEAYKNWEGNHYADMLAGLGTKKSKYYKKSK